MKDLKNDHVKKISPPVLRKGFVAFCLLLAVPSFTLRASMKDNSTNSPVDLHQEITLSAYPQAKSSQRIKITGKILNENNQPVIGASIIQISSPTNGTQTGIDGTFKLMVPADAKLSVSFIGYEKKIVSVNHKNNIGVVKLLPTSNELNAVVVVGYGIQKKKDLTGAITNIKMDDAVGNRPVTDVQSALVGAAPGISISGDTGEPGSDMSINIRGQNTSINGGSPLILVDNMPTENLSMINPNDVESITVLKDAASAAIYGARAAFGVVLVTTKKGKRNQKVKFNYSTNLIFNTPINLPQKATPYQTVKGYLDSGETGHWDGHDDKTWLNLISDYNNNPGKYPGGIAYVPSPDGKGGSYYPLKQTDLYDDMMEDSGFGFSQMHNLSVSGGSDKINYRMSLGLIDLDGVLHTNKDSFKRYNINSFINADVTKWLSISIDAKYNYSRKSSPYNINFNGGYGVWASAASFPSYYPTGGMMFQGDYYRFATPRNILDADDNPDLTIMKNMRLQGGFKLHPFKGLTINGDYGISKTDYDFTDYIPIINGFLKGEEFSPVTNNNGYSYYQKNTYNRQHETLNLYGTYEFNLKKEHNFSVMAGFNQEHEFRQDLNASKQNLLIDGNPSINTGTKNLVTNDAFDEYAIRGVFGRFMYDYKGKYLAQFNGRYDGSSKFPKNHRFGFFPSFSAGWRLSEESFMDKTRSIFSNIKLRASYGSIGNQAIANYGFYPMLTPVTNGEWLVNGDNAVTYKDAPGMVRDDYTWEKANTVNVGLDLGLFNKVNATFEYFVRKTLGMLGPSGSYPNILGTTPPLSNSADMRTNGWEVDLNYNDKIGNVLVRASFNLSDATSVLTRYKNDAGSIIKDGANPDDPTKFVYYKGQKMGDIWGYVSDRLYQESDFEPAVPGQPRKLKPGIPKVRGVDPKPGDMLYKDLNGDGIIDPGSETLSDPGDRKVIGNSTPRFIYGFNLGATWKDFDISVFFQGVGKRDVWLGNDFIFPFNGTWSTMYANQLDYWTPDNPNAFYPRLYEKAGMNTGANRKIQSRFLSDASYLRFKNITVSYNLPQVFLKKYGVDGVKVFFSTENVATFDHLARGLDAEYSTVTSGKRRSHGSVYPLMRKYSFGVNVSF